MSADLIHAITGEAPRDPAPRPPRANVVTTLDCPCAGRLALLDRAGGRSYLWVEGYRHTRRATADLLRAAAIDDGEKLLATEDRAALDAVLKFLRIDLDDLAALIPPLTIPARDLHVTGIGARHDEAQKERPGVYVFPEILAECRNCRALRDVGPAVVELEPVAAPPRRRTVQNGAVFGPESIDYDRREDTRARRVLLYRQLSAVLAS